MSLDPRLDIERTTNRVREATGAAAGLLLLDSAEARAMTESLLDGGLTEEEAVQVAMLNNPRARAALLSVGVSRADFVQSTLFTNPTLTLSFRFPDGGGLANFETAVSQNIAELWLIPSRREAAQRRLDRTVLESATALARIVHDARRAFVHAAKTLEDESLQREALTLAEQLWDVAKLRQEAGAGNEIDVNLARTRRLEAETLFRAAKLATIEARSDLGRVLGLSTAPETLRLIPPPAPGRWSVSPDTLLQIARANRLDLQVADQTVGEALARAREERARFLKSVEVGFALERGERRPRGQRDWIEETIYDSIQSGQLTPPNLLPPERQEQDVIVGPTLGIELPLWDQNQAQIAKADFQWQQAVQWRDALLIDMAQDVHSRLARAQTAAEDAIFYREQQLPAAERNVTLTREAYRAGRASLLTVLEAERTYLGAKIGYLDALERAAVATIELEQVTGRPVSALQATGGQPDAAVPAADPVESEVEP